MFNWMIFATFVLCGVSFGESPTPDPRVNPAGGDYGSCRNYRTSETSWMGTPCPDGTACRTNDSRCLNTIAVGRGTCPGTCVRFSYCNEEARTSTIDCTYTQYCSGVNKGQYEGKCTKTDRYMVCTLPSRSESYIASQFTVQDDPDGDDCELRYEEPAQSPKPLPIPTPIVLPTPAPTVPPRPTPTVPPRPTVAPVPTTTIAPSRPTATKVSAPK